MTARRHTKNLKKLERRQERRVRIAKWHKKFAWRPLKISTPDDDNEHSTIVWFETVMQKGRVGNNYSNDMPQFDTTTWTRYPEKEYFKKKLDGTLEPEETFDFSHDGTDMSMQGGSVTVQGGMGAGATRVQTTKGNPRKGPPGPSIGPPR